jgi:small-conductance mechanosensitive channel
MEDGRRAAASRAVAQMRRAARRRLRARARKARRQMIVIGPLLVGVFLVYRYRIELFGPGADTAVRCICALALVGLGWWFARDVGRAITPTLFSRMEPSTAGVVGFLIRLVLLVGALLVAFRVAGLSPDQLAVGGAATAVVVGLAAQGTLGNVFAGLLLLAVQPFHVGERVRLQAGGLAGNIEGVVTSLGLLYVIMRQGEDVVMVPNSVVIAAAIVPLREPAGVDLLARFEPGLKPSALEAYLERSVKTPTRSNISIGVDAVGQDEVVMRIRATPEHDRDGARLADEILEALEQIVRLRSRPEGELEPVGTTSQVLSS